MYTHTCSLLSRNEIYYYYYYICFTLLYYFIQYYPVSMFQSLPKRDFLKLKVFSKKTFNFTRVTVPSINNYRNLDDGRTRYPLEYDDDDDEGLELLDRPTAWFVAVVVSQGLVL